VPFNNKFYEVQGHLNITQHIADSFVVALSAPAWAKIPEAQQAAVQEAATKMIEAHDAQEIAQEAEIIEKLAGLGMQVNRFEDGELAKTQEIARGIYSGFEEMIGADFMKESVAFVGA
jgi:TRAP-type C4-dicarboxylate transport system substrate-binding protein